MNRYQILPYEAEHERRMALNERSEETAAIVGLEKMIEAHSQGPAFTGFFDGEVVGMAGVMRLWPRVGEAWAMFAPGASDRHRFFIARSARRLFGEILDAGAFERIQAVVEERFDRGRAWVKSLGFEYEGSMPKYFNGKTFLRYAIVR